MKKKCMCNVCPSRQNVAHPLLLTSPSYIFFTKKCKKGMLEKVQSLEALLNIIK